MPNNSDRPRTGNEEPQACESTDRELWREREGDYYADSLHVTEQGGIGINCGGSVYVMPLRNWHHLAVRNAALVQENERLVDALKDEVSTRLAAEGVAIDLERQVSALRQSLDAAEKALSAGSHGDNDFNCPDDFPNRGDCSGCAGDEARAAYWKNRAARGGSDAKPERVIELGMEHDEHTGRITYTQKDVTEDGGSDAR